MKPKLSTTIHINPRFRNIHINPMFLSKTVAPPPAPAAPASNIYINPKFLNDPSILHNGHGHQPEATVPMIDFDEDEEERKMDWEPESVVAHIYTNNSRKLVRAPTLPSTPATISPVKASPSKPRLIKIGSRKLVRARPQPKPISIPQAKVTRKPIQTKYKIVKEQSTFKIDRRTIPAKSKLPHKRLTLCRSLSGIMDLFTSTNVITSNYKLVKM